jgi:hypothetical protein
MRMRPLTLVAWLAAIVVGLLAILALTAWWLVTPERIRTSLEAQATSAIGVPTRIERLSVDWFPRVALRLGNVRVGDPAQLTASELDVSAGLRGLLSRRVEDAALTIRKSRLDLPALLHLVARMTRADPERGGSEGSSGFTVASVRSISLEDVTLVAGGHEIVASAAGRMDPGALAVSSLHARTAGTSLEGSGTIAFAPAPSARFEANAAELDINALLAFVTAAGAGADATADPAGSPGAAPHVDFTLKAARGVLGTIAFTDLATHLTMAGAQVALDPLKARFFGGALDGRMTYDQAAPVVHIDGSLAGADVTSLLRWMGKTDDPVTGRVNATVNLSANPTRLTADAVRGTARISMTDGVIRGLSAIRTSVVSLAGRQSAGNTQGSDRYERISGTFALQGSVIRSTNLQLTSPDMDLRGEGTITMPQGALNIRADCILSPQLSADAGRDLYRYAREGDRIVIPLSIGGVLGAPSVTPRSGEVIERALRRKVEEELGSRLKKFLKR